MNIAFLRASLRLWERRLAFRRRKHDFYHHRSRRPAAERRRLATKWHKLAAEAEAKVARRRRQLAARRPARQVAVDYALAHRGVRENPPGSNRGGAITTWQKALGSWLIGTPWCGEFAAACLRAAGVNGVTARLASVALIEEDAKAHRGCFRGWTAAPGKVNRGDLVVLFGYGVHVEVVRDVKNGVVHTIGGNTSSGASGSQSNGGGVYARARPMSAVRGFALVNYPG